jgi:hypothetical protein
MSEELTVKTVISEENMEDIINAIKSVLFSLSEKYATSFEDYIGKSLSDLDSLDEKINNEHDAEFWNTFIIIMIEFNSYSLESIHNHWVTIMENSGWGWNTSHNPNKKVCPLLIEYAKLTQEEQTIIRLWSSIVWAMAVQEDDGEESDEAQAIAA